MNRRRIFLLLALGAFSQLAAPQVAAKAAFASAEEMISRSEVIAIVNISRVEETQIKGSAWTYREVAHATVEQSLKGTLPRTVQLHGNESFICAQVRFQPGRFIVFLRHDEKLLVGSNWHLSLRPIREGQIEWYVPRKQLALSWQAEAEVLQQIERTIKAAK